MTLKFPEEESIYSKFSCSNGYQNSNIQLIRLRDRKKTKQFNKCSLITSSGVDRFTFSGHLGQQLVCKLLREEYSLPEAQGAVGALQAKALQVLAHICETQVSQGRRRRLILKYENKVLNAAGPVN